MLSRNIQQPLVYNAGTDEAPFATMNFFSRLFPSPFAILFFSLSFLSFFLFFSFFGPCYLSSSFSRRFLLVPRGARRREEKNRIEPVAWPCNTREHGERRFAELGEKLARKKTRTWPFARTREQGKGDEEGDTYRETAEERDVRSRTSVYTRV
mgnify:CR=1 FL=1